jgi:hypothetical protein
MSSRDWHVDLQTDYVTYFPADLGFSVGFLPRDFSSDGLSPDDFVAEPSISRPGAQFLTTMNSRGSAA